jgi:hypothetical protein|tara:strand:- start:738 stop:863 length:126 start_codon:yes stop_codon:yes gene_type:complete
MAETEEEKYRKLRNTLAIGEVQPKAGEGANGEELMQSWIDG